MLSIQLPNDVETRLGQLARRTGRSEESWAKEAIQEYLDDLDDLLIAEQRSEDLRAGRSRAYTLEEVERELGLAD